MSAGRRPITAEETPHLVALGRELAAMRSEAGMTQEQVALLVQLSAGHVCAIERGRRRTRRSTLERVVAVLVADELDREAVVVRLVEAAGPGLAPESDFAERVTRRRERRARQHRAAAIAAADETVAMLRRSLARLEGDALRDREAQIASLEDVGARLRSEDGGPVLTRRQRRAVEVPAAEEVEPAATATALVPAHLAERIRREGLSPEQRERFEQAAAAPGPHQEAVRAALAIDDARWAS